MHTIEGKTVEPDTRWKRRISPESDSGFLWFLETSWHYINPNGVIEVIRFFVEFPKAYLGFRKSMLG